MAGALDTAANGEQQLALPKHTEPTVALPGEAMILAYSQGDCDKLCGLYSIINGLRLALVPSDQLSESDSRELFAEGLRYLERQGKLSRTLHHGMPTKLWYKLARHLTVIAAELTHVPLTIKRLFRDKEDPRRSQVFARLEEVLRLGQVPLMLVAGGARHYTVLTGYNQRCFSAADSAYLPVIYRSECRVDSHGKARLTLYPGSILVICAAGGAGSGCLVC